MSTGFRSALQLTKFTFVREVPGDWVAVQLGYTGHRCILDHHRKNPSANYLQRWGDPEIVWYRCWPCGVNLNAYALLKETVDRSDFEGDLEDETLVRAEALLKEWRDVEGWASDEALFKQGSASWTDLGGGGEPGWTPATKEELEGKIRSAQEDPKQLDRALQTYRKERKERSYPPCFDSFDEIPAEFIRDEFGWGAEGTFDTILVPIYSAAGELVSIRYMNAWRKWSERGHAHPVLYGLERRRDHIKILVVEGIADTVRLAWEFKDAADTFVAGLVSASFDEAKLPLEVFAGREVTILGDAGDAGARATAKLVDALSEVASVSVVPLPDGYRDVCSYEGDLRSLLATAEPCVPPHYLERPEVAGTLDGIRNGMSRVELDRLLRGLPPLPADPLTVTMIRDEVAGRLKDAGFRVQIADAYIKSAPRESAEREFEEVAHRMAEPEPWPDEVEGRELIAEVRAAIKRFVYIGDEDVYDVLAAWVVHTFMFNEFPTTAYLHVTAPSMMSGKTRLLEILEEFCRRSLLAGGLSPAVLYRAVEMFRPTLLIDEADTIFKIHSEASEAIRQVLNNGYTRGKPILRMVPNPDGSQQPVPFDPYSPKALAGIGRIPDTITSRSITIQMVRKKSGEEAERYSRRQREQLRNQATSWKRKAERWVADHAGRFDFDPEFPPGLSDRVQDCWEPLFVVGEMIDADWAARLRAAALHLNAKSADLESLELGDALLADLKGLLEEGHLGDHPHVATGELLRALNCLDERPWPHLKGGQGLNAKSLADLMKGFEIRPMRFERNTVRGYAVADIREALDRWG